MDFGSSQLLERTTYQARSFYEENGYSVVRGGVREDAIEAVHSCLQTDIYPSTQPMLRHPSNKKDPHEFITSWDGNRIPANALVNPHFQAETQSLGAAILDLVCCDAVADAVLELDGERRHTIHQIILFFVPPGMNPHIDGWPVDTVPPGGLCTLWIPLEPITLRNGPVCIFPWRRGHFVAPSEMGVDLEYYAYHHALEKSLRSRICVVPQLDPGDYLAFSSLTPHGTLPPVHNPTRRLAIQILCRPTNSPWGGNIINRMRGERSDCDNPETVDINARWCVT
jgi:ectoine hydroxylase-related dioxygenase (phytanoyl-CoA dioxygenase family)